MLKTRLLLLSILALLALAAAGCGDDTEPSAADRAAQRAEEEAENRPAAEEAQPVEAETVQPSAGEADLSRKPRIPRATGAAPTELVAQDLIEGDGAAAKAGDQVSVQYVGVLFKNNEEFDASWDSATKPGDPFPFQIGAGAVIPGWDRGVVGMKVGGRRKLIIPPDLAYGAQGQPPDIGPNETLVFDIDLKKIG